MSAVLVATLDELANSGYARMSIEEIATRAGVNRTTVYRRWPTKSDLVRAAILGLTADRPPPPDTGSLREDLLGILARLQGQSPRNLALMRGVMSEISDPEVAALVRVIGTQHQAGLITVVVRAVERGELPRGTVAEHVIEPIIATFFMRSSMSGHPPAPADIERIIDLVLDGARSGAAIAPGESPREGSPIQADPHAVDRVRVARRRRAM